MIYITDVHLKTTTPRCRIDDYYKETLNDIEEVLKLCQKDNHSLVIGGDLGDSWDWKISMLNDVSAIMEKHKVPVYCIVGNHDVPGRNWEEYKNSGIYALQKFAPNTFKILLEAEEIDGYLVCPFHSDWEETDCLLEQKGTRYDPVLDTTKLKKVAIVHANVGQEDTPWCRGYKSVIIKNFDYALFGDIHTGWETCYKSSTGCYLVNPGALGRLSFSDKGRTIRAFVLKNGKHKFVDLKVNKDVFVQKVEKEITEFFIDSVKLQQYRKSTEELIKEICLEMSVEQKIQKHILDSLALL